MFKKCTKCGEEKTLDCFSKHKGGLFGLASICKACKKEYQEKNKIHFLEYRKKYREENKERIAKRDKKYCEENKELLAKKHKEYYEKNKEAVLRRVKKHAEENKEIVAKRQKKWREEHKEYLAIKSKEWFEEHKEAKVQIQKRYREKHKEALVERAKKFREENKKVIAKRAKKRREENKEALAEYYKRPEVKERIRLQGHNRRALLKKLKGVLTVQEWNQLLDLYNYTCPCCGKKRVLTIDHVVPVNWHEKFPEYVTNYVSNNQPLCRSCNSTKNDHFAVHYLPSNYYENKLVSELLKLSIHQEPNQRK